jgi:hypothetical protein
MDGGDEVDCTADGVAASCGEVQAWIFSGAAVGCPNNNCAIGTPNPFQCVDSVCGYMSARYVATHENEWNGVLYSDSEWQAYLDNLVDAQRRALADAIVDANPKLDWQTVYGELEPLFTKGGNVNFEYTGNLQELSFIPGSADGGCEWLCRFGDIPSIHMAADYDVHLDSANPLWGFGLGLVIHGFIDVLLGNINPSVPLGHP